MNHPRLLRLTIGSLLAALFMSACGAQASPVPTAVPPTPIPPSPTATPSSSESRATILAAFRALKDKPSLRQREETVLSDGKTHTTVVESITPDRYHIFSDPIEFIVIGQKVYIKQNDVWAESQIPAANIIGPDYYKGLEESISDIQFIGTDSLNEKPVQVYQYKSKTKIGDAESTIQTKLWIGMVDNLPYKMIMDGDTASLDSSTGKVVGVKSVATILFEYDAIIKIDPPIK